jgi:hypothetical protein
VSNVADALTEAREQERLILQSAIEQTGFVAALGEADVGKTFLLNRLGLHLESQGMWVVHIDLDGAYSTSELAWLWSRALARSIAGSDAFSHLTSLDSSMWPGRTRQAALKIDQMLGPQVSALALGSTSPPPRGATDDLEALRQAISATGRAAALQRPVLLIVDHLEAPMLTPRHPVDVRGLLWMVRAESQGNTQLRVLVSGRSGVEDDFAASDAAFYQDGRVVRLERPDYVVWERALAQAGGRGIDLYRVLTLTDHHIPTTLQLLEALQHAHGAEERVADIQFSRLAGAQNAHARRCVQHARTLDRLGGRILEAVARDLPPYGAVSHGHPKEVQRALTRLRLAGLIHQDAPRKWRVVDPFVADELRSGLPADAWRAVRNKSL